MMPARPSTAQSHTFGHLAVEAGIITDDQLIELRREQEAAERAGKHVHPMEELAVSRGFMDADQVRLIKMAEDRIKRDERRGQPMRIGGYEILGKLGDGGLGTVYKARQISMGRIVALKVLHKQWMQDEEFKKRFLLEARLAGRMSHQNLIQVYDVGRENDTYYFSMEFVDGETVEAIIDRDGPMPVAQALDITIQVLRAITYIWRYKIVHRDIKPGNIMLTRSGVTKLADFGFVKSKFDPLLSTEGEVLGTPDYISPEQAMGLPDINVRSDIYSLGATLYHMLGGHPPFTGSSSQVMRKHVKEEPVDLRTHVPDLPQALADLVKRMMAKNPEDRYGSTQELFEDIELVRMGQTPQDAAGGAGKVTILRAFQIEKGRLDRMQSELKAMEARLNRAHFAFYGALGGCAVLLATLVAMVFRLQG